MGPLHGIRLIEVAGIGPGPFCAMLLADLGAEVLRIDRPRPSPLAAADPTLDYLNRNRRSIALDLKRPDGVEAVLRLCTEADGLLEGFRPGVAERLGIGPDACLARNRKLVYGRMTGWGQTGPLARAAGHDLNYVALSGALSLLPGPEGRPGIPLNLVGDFGGGGLYLALGMVAALLEASRSGEGQVVDAAIVDGTASLITAFHGLRAQGLWFGGRGENLLDGGAPFYDVYETRDKRHVTIAALEPQFYEELITRLDLPRSLFLPQLDPSRFPERRAFLAEKFKERTRDEWTELLEGSDVCFAPVLDLDEVGDHPHLAARQTHIEVEGRRQPAPAPRFSRTPPGPPQGPRRPGQDGAAALRDWGFSSEETEALAAAGALIDPG
jgi:alpha-methylacyl-CoA racemase